MSTGGKPRFPIRPHFIYSSNGYASVGVVCNNDEHEGPGRLPRNKVLVLELAHNKVLVLELAHNKVLVLELARNKELVLELARNKELVLELAHNKELVLELARNKVLELGKQACSSESAEACSNAHALGGCEDARTS